jgi:hypothetical protein
LKRCLLHALVAMALTWSNPGPGDRCAAQEVVPFGASGGRVEQHLQPEVPRRRIIVGVPSSEAACDGELLIEPNVSIATDTGLLIPEDGTYGQLGQFQAGSGLLVHPPGNGPLPESLPPVTEPWPRPREFALPSAEEMGRVEPMFDDLIQGVPPDSWPICDSCGSAGSCGACGSGGWRGFFNTILGPKCSTGCEGVAKSRLAQALFRMDPAQPESSFRARLGFYDNQVYPDRAEYFWARVSDGRGPTEAESNVDFQELRLRMQLGSEKFSTTTEVPFRWTNPTNNGNHAGLGDINLRVKTVLLDGESLQITMYMGNYFQSGAPSMGLGTGHYSLEPGFLFRYKCRDQFWLHSQVKYLIPFGADPDFKGEVLQYGLGVNRLLWENDYFGVIPSFEFVGWSVSDGKQTSPQGDPISADGENMLHFVPGVHFVRDSGCDAGLVEIGISTEIAIANDRWYDSSVLVDLRWSW